jgi:CDP-6-deoxy-D-xylo-4-hexulose-3-dehydrase
MGEGGAVYTDNEELAKLVDSFRDWGRDCWCPSGKDDTCRRRFAQQFGELPAGYDHKYVYSHFGYNLKVTDMQAAIGCAQLKKLPDFIVARKRNWELLRKGLEGLEDLFVLPEAAPNSEPSWFGFLLTVRLKAGFNREQIVNHLEQNGIQTRMLFAGNLIMHPCFDEMRQSKSGYRVSGVLDDTNRIMNDTFWVGVYPGMTDEMLTFIVRIVREFCHR